MARRRKNSVLSPTVLTLFLVVAIVIRGLTLLPSNDEALLNASLHGQLEEYSPSGFSDAAIPPGAGAGRNQTIVFVHVGKTGGETIQWRIKLSCKLRRSKLLKEECFEHFVGEDESALSKATVGYLHCDKLRPKASFSNATAFMFSLRNPIDRIVSWFQYMHPDNCVPNRPSGACNLKLDKSPWGSDFYGKCFPDINDFVRSIGEVMTKQAVNCSALALETVRGNGPEGSSNHMHFNYRYYANRTIHMFPEKAILAVRQESLWEDLRGVEGFLGGDPRRMFERQGPTITHGSERFRYRAALDPTLAPLLCCAIQSEIQIYRYVLEHALNLKSQQKSKSLETLLQKCAAKSFEDLVKTCKW